MDDTYPRNGTPAAPTWRPLDDTTGPVAPCETPPPMPNPPRTEQVPTPTCPGGC